MWCHVENNYGYANTNISLPPSGRLESVVSCIFFLTLLLYQNCNLKWSNNNDRQLYKQNHIQLLYISVIIMVTKTRIKGHKTATPSYPLLSPIILLFPPVYVSFYPMLPKDKIKLNQIINQINQIIHVQLQFSTESNNNNNYYWLQ